MFCFQQHSNYVFLFSQRPFSVDNSADITIRNSVFDGDEVPSNFGAGDFGNGYGLYVSYSDNVVIENNEFFEFFKALVVTHSTNTTVLANDIHTIASDGINFASVDGLLIEGNWIHDFKIDLASGDPHADMIQSWTTAGETSAKNVTISGNFLDAGTGSWTHSIFMRNGVVDLGLGSFTNYAYQNDWEVLTAISGGITFIVYGGEIYGAYRTAKYYQP